MFEYVKINETTRPVKFGFNALRHFSRMTGMSIQDMDKIGQNMTFDNAISLIFCGLQDGCRAAKEDFTMSIDDLADDLDNDYDAIERCMVIFADMMTPDKQKKSQEKKKKGKSNL